MKKIILTAMLLLAMTSTVLAATPITEQFYAFSNRDKDAITEVNYYLSLGATVKFLQSVQRGIDGTFTSMVIQIPTDVFQNQPYVKK